MPSALVVASRARFVFVLMSVTVAPGTAAPLLSVTLPTSVP